MQFEWERRGSPGSQPSGTPISRSTRFVKSISRNVWDLGFKGGLTEWRTDGATDRIWIRFLAQEPGLPSKLNSTKISFKGMVHVNFRRKAFISA